MPISRGAPTATAQQMISQLGGDTRIHEGRALQYKQAAIGVMRAKLERLLRHLDVAAERKHQETLAEKAGEAGDGSLWGAGAGAAASVALAPFTGGASLTMMPAMMAGGSQVGAGVTSGRSQDIATGFATFQDPMSELFTQNDPTLAAPAG